MKILQVSDAPVLSQATDKQTDTKPDAGLDFNCGITGEIQSASENPDNDTPFKYATLIPEYLEHSLIHVAKYLWQLVPIDQ